MGMGPWAVVLFGAAVTAMTAKAAELKAPDFSLSSPSSREVVAHAPAGYHFNLEAPMKAELNIDGKASLALKPAKSSPEKVSFEFAETPKGAVTYTLYLCDNPNSFCEAHSVQASLAQLGPAPKLIASQPAGEGSPLAAAAEHVAQFAPKIEHGFLVNAWKVAFAQAEAQNKPLIIDFYGIWCPPCNELDEEVFPSKEFVTASKNFIKLKLDADAEVSWELKSRYRIGGYPTVIFADSKGEEISRIVGFRNKAVFTRLTQQAYRDRNLPFSALKTRALKGDKTAAGKLGLMYLERREFVLAQEMLARAPKTAEYLEAFYSAEIGELEESQKPDSGAETEAKLIAKLESALHDFPKTPSSLERRSSLAELYDGRKQTEKQRALLEEQVKIATGLTKNPAKLVDFDLNIMDLWGVVAEAEESLGHADAAKTAWKNAAAEYQKRIGKLGQTENLERGYNIERAYCLWKSGDVASAEKLYTELQGRYPNEFTFYFGHARMNYSLKKVAEANALAARAYSYSYGDNKLRVAELLAKTLKDQDKKKEALAVIEETLKTVPVPSDSTIRTHRYVKALEKLQKQLM